MNLYIFLDKNLHNFSLVPSALAITYCLLQASAVKGVDLASNPIYSEAIVTWHLMCAHDRVFVTSCVGDERQYLLPRF